MGDLVYSELTDKIIHCFYDVYNTLGGFGFLEKVYEKSMLISLAENRLKAESQLPIKVYFHDKVVGNYFADIIVEDKVILELKAEETLRERDIFQLLNYLKATGLEVGLLLNFGKKPSVRRVVNTQKE
mgnify:CR=1 FL=1